MTLHARFLVALGLILILAFASQGLLTWRHIREEAAQEALIRAEEVRGILAAIRQVYDRQFEVSGLPLDDRTLGFLPAHALSRISREFSEGTETGLSFGNVSDRPRNPDNRADAMESGVIRYFTDHPDQSLFLRRHDNPDGTQHIHYARPIRAESQCLGCHASPEEAPSPIRTAYASGFGHQEGDLLGILSIRMPDAHFHAVFSALFQRDLLIHLATFLLIFVLVNRLWARVVTRPMGRLIEGMGALSSGLADRPPITGLPGEFSRIGEAFNRMAAAISREIASRERAQEAIAQLNQELEERVAQRTAELAIANDRLRREAEVRLRHEAALAEEKERAEMYLAMAGTMIVALDAEANVLLINRKGEEVLGRSADELVGRNWMESVIPAEERAAVRAHFDGIMDGDAVLSEQFENEVTTRDGQRRLIAWRNALLTDAGGRVTGTLGSGEDITEMRAIERERGRLQAQALRSARLATVGTLAAGLAHEINNPNNAINFNAEVLIRFFADLPPVLQEYGEAHGALTLGGLSTAEAIDAIPRLLEGVRAGSDRIRGIVADLIGLSRPENEAEPTEVCLATALRNAVLILGEQIRQHTQAFSLEVEEEVSSIWGHAPRIEQVFINLILNALQSLPGRERAVQVSLSRVPRKAEALVRVRDEGRGVAPSDLEKLAEPFFTTREASGGAGLGLSICQSIIKAHRGRLQFTSTPGKGTEAAVFLPLAEPETDRSPEGAS